jgi:type I restriction enzyme S subunit
MSAIGTLLESVILPVRSWDPARDAPDRPLTYVDLSSIDRDTKEITSPQRMLGAEAPSRARQALQAGDVLVSTVRPNLNAVAQVFAALDGATGSTGFCVLRADASRLDGRYLFHWVRSPGFIAEMVSRTTGASYPAVSDRVVRGSKIPLPPLPEQRRIAAILDKADAVHRKRQQTLDLADQFLRSAFLDTFGDPVTNPKGWPMRCIADIAEDARGSVVIGPFGSDLKVADYRSNGHPVVFVRDVGEAGLQWISRIYVDDQKFGQLAAHQVMSGDVVVTKMGTPPGVAAVYPATMPIGVVTADIIRVRADSQKSQPQYLAAVLNSAWVRSRVQQITEGVTRPKITLGSFKRLLVPVPPLEEQVRWAILLAARCALTATAAASSSISGELLNSLLQRAFQGEL